MQSHIHKGAWGLQTETSYKGSPVVFHLNWNPGRGKQETNKQIKGKEEKHKLLRTEL